MTIAEYQSLRNLTDDEFAEKADIPRATFKRAKKHGPRTTAVLQKIVAACEGLVLAEDFIGKPPRQRRKRSAA